MRTYEFMLVVRPDFPDDEAKRSALVKKLLSEATATVKDIQVFGKKQLAYPIKKFTEAVYLLVNVEAEAIQVGPIESQVKLSTDVLRYLLTVKE